MIRSNDTSRPLVWGDEAPAETRFRRVQKGVPPTGRNLPGMPLEMTDPDGDDSPRRGPAGYSPQRFESARRSWWRPASTWGRVFLGTAFLIVLGGFAAGGYLLKTYMARDARFRISGAGNIEATGLTQVSRSEMLPIFGEDIGRNIFFVPLAERRKQLEQIPWIERATVMRVLPDQLRIAVEERKPVAFVRHGQQIGLVDASGVLLSMPASTMAQHHYSFPVVTGIDPADPLVARKGRMAVYGRLLGELDANQQHLSEQVSEIDLTDPEDARVLMPEQGADILAHLGEDHFLERYQRYKAHIAEWRQQYPKLAAVDLRYDQQVVLEMTSGASGTATTTGQTTTSPADAKTPAAEPLKKEAAKPAAKAKPQKPATKAGAAARPGAKSSPKTKNAVSKQEKKRVAAKRAALALNQKKKARLAAVAVQGQ